MAVGVLFGRRVPGWQGLGLVWGGLLVVACLGAGVLQYLGPMSRPVAVAAPAQVAASTHTNPDEGDSHGSRHDAAPSNLPAAPGTTAEPEQTVTHDAVKADTRVIPRVHPPDPALLEGSAEFAPAQLPRIAADGRAARVVYAGPLPAGAAGMPRVALLLSGFGLSERDSRAALDQLPGPVSFAVSAYAKAPGLVDAARESGHELLASVPMEPQGYPMNDEGVRSLRTGLSPEENQKNLQWSLSRIQGAVGATAASDGMKGERFADVTGVFDPALEEIGRRGLLYIDPRPGRALARTGLASRSVDLVIDEPMARAAIEGRLVALERIARERGSAVGLAGPLRPVTIERIAAWIGTLRDRGLVLVPVSALVGDGP